jgi:hypothetical protein
MKISCIIGNEIYELEETVYRIAMYLWDWPVNRHRSFDWCIARARDIIRLI